MRRTPQRGFTLIELAIVVTLLGVLLSVALPAVTDWIATQRVRTAAEGVLNGLQLARAEAVRQNTFANLNIAADGISWDVVANGATVQTRGADTGTGITSTPAGPTTITFNGVGRLIAPDPVTSPFAIKYTSSVSGVRAMCVTMMSNSPRLCDPQLTVATDARSCFVNGVRVTGCPP